MPSANLDEEAIVRSMRRLRHADQVNDYVKEPLEEAIHYEGSRAFIAMSDDILMLLVFCYIGFLGYLYKCSHKPIHAVEFIREYLGKVDRRYAEVGGLLYDALRHGMFHFATPKRIKLQDGKILDFLFTRAQRREDLFKIVKMPEKQRTGATYDIYRLTLDLPIMYKDLLSAIDKYAEDIKSNQELSDTFSKALETRRKPERATEGNLIEQSYIQQSDFDFVREQISNCN